MKSVRRIAITATCLAAVSFFVAYNTWLAKPTYGRPCFPVFIVPFTEHEKSFELPLWMWGYPLMISMVSMLAAIGCWIALFVRRWRLRRLRAATANS
jgi:hypothetical protein